MNKFLHFFSTFFQTIKKELKRNNFILWLVLVLLSIPLDYKINTFSVVLLLIFSVLHFKKNNFVVNPNLFLPIGLYLLMAVSVIWSIDTDRTIPALSKEMSLLIIPLCFMLFGGFSDIQKQKITQYYSYGIFAYSIYYLINAVFKYFETYNTNVFFYHELVTKDVNAIHVSVYVAVAFFYFLIKTLKTYLDYSILAVLLLMVFLLSSENIMVAFTVLVVIYHLFYTKHSQKMRLKNLVFFGFLLSSLFFVDKIKNRLNQEYETIMTDSTINDVVQKNNTITYNVSIKQAWTNPTFNANDYFPGTAFRVYQFRIFLEMMHEDAIFWTGYGLNASYPKIEAKGIQHHIYLGEDNQEGYQKKNFHNQYVQNFAELGIFGFLLLIVMLFVNLKNGIKNSDFLQITFGVLMISLFLTESFLWRQRGVVFFTVLFCLFNSNNKIFSNNDNNQNGVSK